MSLIGPSVMANSVMTKLYTILTNGDETVPKSVVVLATMPGTWIGIGIPAWLGLAYVSVLSCASR